MIAALLVAVAAGVALVWLGWSGRRRWSMAGWALAGLGLLTLAGRDGAWALALGIVAGMATECAALVVEAWRTPAHAARHLRPATPPPARVAWPDLARRVMVFVLVVPLGFAASAWLAVAVEHLGRAHGMGGADAAVCCWLGQPIAWAALIAVQMTREGPRAMLTPLVVATAGGALLWAAG